MNTSPGDPKTAPIPDGRALSRAGPVILLIPLGKSPQPFADADLRRKAVIALQGLGVGVGHRHVARLHAHQLAVRLEIIVRREHAGAHRVPPPMLYTAAGGTGRPSSPFRFSGAPRMTR